MTSAQRRELRNLDSGQCSRQGATTQQPTIDRSVRGAVTTTEAAVIVMAEASVPPPPFSTVVVVDKGNGRMELTAPMAVLLKAEAVDGGGGDGVVAVAVDNNNLWW